jgi:hypothetical protein
MCDKCTQDNWIFYDDTVNAVRYVNNILRPFFTYLTEEEVYTVFSSWILQQLIRLRYVRKHCVALGGVVVSVLATGPKVRGFKPGRGRWILRVIKSVARLPSEGK